MSNNTEKVSIVMHPKAFAAFGADLVTNDVVALIELVKNSYDAFAYDVLVEFAKDENGESILTIADNGLGMTKEVIINAWAVIATNNKGRNPYIERDGKIRAVSGNKGMGRFSAARLGSQLTLITKTRVEGAYKIHLDWEMFNSANAITDCTFLLEKINDDFIQSESGTILTISKLNHIWGGDDYSDLQEELSRIINPFGKNERFNITFKYNGEDNPIDIQVPEFVNHPKYLFNASVDSDGNVEWTYSFSPLKKELDFSNNVAGILTWNEILEDLQSELNKTAQKTIVFYLLRILLVVPLRWKYEYGTEMPNLSKILPNFIL